MRQEGQVRGKEKYKCDERDEEGKDTREGETELVRDRMLHDRPFSAAHTEPWQRDCYLRGVQDECLAAGLEGGGEAGTKTAET